MRSSLGGRPWLVAASAMLALWGAPPVACTGAGFSSAPSAGQGGSDTDGGRHVAEGGAQGGDVSTDDGGSSSGADGGSAGAPIEATAGAVGTPGGFGGSAAGAGGTGAASGAGGVSTATCDVGATFADHCYVDLKAQQLWTHPNATAACASLGDSLGRVGYLPYVETVAELNFLVETFMAGREATEDAWLSLTCSALPHPDFADCLCNTSCSVADFTRKRQNWLWVDTVSSGFGWHDQSPNGDGRCAALTYKPAFVKWGWADRDCNLDTFIVGLGEVHIYRALCELE